MANINLLPWREEFRQEKKKEFLGIIVAVAIFALVVVFFWDRTVNAAIETQISRNNLLSGEIAVLNRQVREIAELKKRKTELLDRTAVIQDLQGNRPDIVRIFDEFVVTVPEGVYISELRRNDRNVTLVGFAESNSRVSAFMRNLDGSYKFTDPNLTRVQADGTLGEQGSRFDMRVRLTPPDTNASEAGEE